MLNSKFHYITSTLSRPMGTVETLQACNQVGIVDDRRTVLGL